MAQLDPRKALEELARREAALVKAGGVEAAIRKELHDKQIALVDDPSERIAALCTRRAGKTSIWVRLATITALKHPGSLIRIWAISRLRCKQMLWDEFLKIHARHKLKVKAHETELTLRFENGSEIRLLGADKDKEAQKKRGDKTQLEIIMESQLFGPFLRTLVEDVVEPCLFDTRGKLILEGTPGPVPTGFWFYVTGDDTKEARWESKGRQVKQGEAPELVGAGWSCHRWSVVDNPFLDQWRGKPNWRELAKQSLEELRKKRNWTRDNPTYIREYTGHWVKDDGILFYKYDSTRNDYTFQDKVPWGPGWKHVLGWDLGSRDDMALVAWGWHEDSRELLQAAEWKKPGATADEVMSVIERWEKLGMNFIAKVADTGGGGRMYVEDVMTRYHHVFEAAKKTEKAAHVRLMNDDFLTGRIKVLRGGEYAQELAALPKDPDWDPDSGSPAGEDPRFPNHLCDAALYSWRRSMAHLDFADKSDEDSEPDALIAELEAAENSEDETWWERDLNEDY